MPLRCITLNLETRILQLKINILSRSFSYLEIELSELARYVLNQTLNNSTHASLWTNIMSLRSIARSSALNFATHYGLSLMLFALINLTGCIVNPEGYRVIDPDEPPIDTHTPRIREPRPVEPDPTRCEAESCTHNTEPECEPGAYEYGDDFDCFCDESGMWDCAYFETECESGDYYERDDCEICECFGGYYECYVLDDVGCSGPAPLPEPEPEVLSQNFCEDWVATRFNYPRDELACNGAQMVRFDSIQALWVGVVSCGDDSFAQVRLYLSDNEYDFFPATDTAGHGQDHCELINDSFGRLRDEDDITSSGCRDCSTTTNLPLENVYVFSRSRSGERFVFQESGRWAYQTTRLTCGPVLCR